MSEQDLDELELAAFRFVAGEMPPDEAISFEKQLAADQPTREAVCRVVAVTERLVQAGPSDNGRAKLASGSESRELAAYSRVVRPFGWMAIGAIAASLVFMVADRFPLESGNQRTELADGDNASPPQSLPPSFDAHQIDTLAWMEMSDVPGSNIEVVWPDEQRATLELLSALNSPTTIPEIPDWILQTNGDIE